LPKTLGRHSLGVGGKSATRLSKIIFPYTAKLNFNNRRLQKIGLSCQRRTPIPQIEPVRFSRDSQIIRFRPHVNEEFANVLGNFVGNGLFHVDLRHP
jgi:hypothetical protein